MSVHPLHPVPHLTTALTGPLQQIESSLLTQLGDIEAWFRDQWQSTPAPYYASVDLRNAGFKLAPVDTNLFPAGFNNLNEAFYPLCIQSIQSVMERVCPLARHIALVPEKHTRNQFYLESVMTLRDLIERAGYQVDVVSVAADATQPERIELPSGRVLAFDVAERSGDALRVNGARPCAVLLNNDLSGGVPALLQGLSQQIIPPLELGWSKRLKSDHFAVYREVAASFANQFGLDPWLIDPMFRNCGEVDFMARGGEECLASSVDDLLGGIRRKYDEYGINREPYVVVKADAGTYGMGIMTATSADDVRGLNRKQRTKMSARKEGGDVSQVIIQEGVFTSEDWQGAAAEPVVYMIDRFVVGGFYRVHSKRGQQENLNAPGMHFEPLAFAEPCNNPSPESAPDAQPNRFYAYGVIARLALVAAAREIAATKAPKQVAL